MVGKHSEWLLLCDTQWTKGPSFTLSLNLPQILEDVLHILHILYLCSGSDVEGAIMHLRPPYLLAKLAMKYCSVHIGIPSIHIT